MIEDSVALLLSAAMSSDDDDGNPTLADAGGDFPQTASADADAIEELAKQLESVLIRRNVDHVIALLSSHRVDSYLANDFVRPW